MKIIILGKNGQLGSELALCLNTRHEVYAYNKQDLDLRDTNKIIETIKQIKPDIIINAAAYTAVDKAEIETELAYSVNGIALKNIATAARDNSAWLIHYSTDYVFDGLNPEPYLETDKTCPLNYYGFSKLAGENFIINSGCKYLIFRTSWVYGGLINNFAATILKLAQQRETIDVVVDQVGAPASVQLISEITKTAISIIDNNASFSSNLYHLAPLGETSWFGFAREIVSVAQKYSSSLKLRPESILPISADSYNSSTKRPANSRLNTNKLQNDFDLRLPHWSDHIEEYVSNMKTTGNI